MSWMPHLMNGWAAAGAAAVAIPSLLVLYFLKLRRREASVSSTLLWRKAIQDLQVNSPFQKLRKNLLLLLQLLLLAFLLLALARPVANYTPGAGKLTVILIDRSGSMSANDVFENRHTTRLEEAKLRAVKDVVDSMGRNDTAMVIAFDDSASIVQPFTTDTARLRDAINAIQPTDRPTKLQTAYKLAQAQAMAFNPEQLRPNGEKPVIFLFSDGRALDFADLSVDAEVRYRPIGSRDCRNVGIVSLSAKRDYEHPTSVQVFARLANFGPEPVKTDVVLKVDDKNAGVATDLLLLPQRWTDDQRRDAMASGQMPKESVSFPSIDIPDAAVIRVEQARKDDDALASDDYALLVVPPAKNLAVELVTDGNYFLEKACDALPNIKKPDVVTPEQYEGGTQNEYDVIIFDRYSPKRLPPSGNFIYFGCVPDPSLDSGVKAQRNEDKLVIEKDVTVLDWKRDHPILRGLSLNKVYATEGLTLDASPTDEVLVSGYKSPIIVLHRGERGTSLVVSFDVVQSNWPLRQSFPAFMNNAMQFMALGEQMNVRQSYTPGATPTIPRIDLQKIGSPKQIRLIGPNDTQTLTPPASGDFVLPPLNYVGLYKTEPPVPQFERLAVSLLDSNESNLEPTDRTPGDPAIVVSTGGGKTRLELWWWIVACAALPLLMIEWWVYTRRVHL